MVDFVYLCVNQVWARINFQSYYQCSVHIRWNLRAFNKLAIHRVFAHQQLLRVNSRYFESRGALPVHCIFMHRYTQMDGWAEERHWCLPRIGKQTQALVQRRISPGSKWSHCSVDRTPNERYIGRIWTRATYNRLHRIGLCGHSTVNQKTGDRSIKVWMEPDELTQALRVLLSPGFNTFCGHFFHLIELIHFIWRAMQITLSQYIVHSRTDS